MNPPNTAEQTGNKRTIRVLRKPDKLISYRHWANVALYTTISSVREILVLHTAENRAVLLRREAAGTWPNNPTALALGVSVRLDSISFIATVAAFYRTAGVA